MDHPETSPDPAQLAGVRRISATLAVLAVLGCLCFLGVLVYLLSRD